MQMSSTWVARVALLMVSTCMLLLVLASGTSVAALPSGMLIPVHQAWLLPRQMVHLAWSMGLL
jgi:hypothetical protein